MDEGFKPPLGPARPPVKGATGQVPLLALSTAAVGDSMPAQHHRKFSQPPPPAPLASSQSKASSRSDGQLSSQMRSSMTKSDMAGLPPSSSPKNKASRPLPLGMAVYSPRWIVSVKRETDKQVKAFLASLVNPATREGVPESLLEQLEQQGNSFLRLRTDLLGEASKAMVRALQKLPTTSAKEKKLVVQLLMAISSCSRLDQYIESVREAENQVSTKGSRHGYDGQMEYQKTESPRLRDSANKRANFLSHSLDADAFETILQLHPLLDAAATNAPTPPPDSAESDLRLCRICEQMVGKSIYDEHVKFCTKKVGYDMEAISADQQLGNLAVSLPQQSLLRKILEKARDIAQSPGGFYECMSLKRDLTNLPAGSAPEELVVQSKELIQRKLHALQASEKTSLQSPRLPSPKMPGGGGTGTPTLERKSTLAKIPTIRDFEIVKPITRGGYGGVYLARKKATHDLYAIKALNRKEMIKRGEMKSILAERNILASLHSDHVVKLFFAMVSKRYLFLVMEYMPGGDCFTLLRKFGRFDEGIAKFYIAEVVLALEDIHRQGVIHRDLKPDNILIDADGHVKLADFGLSAVGLMNKQARDGEEDTAGGGVSNNQKHLGKSAEPTVTHEGGVRGTPHYLAPEILLGLPHGQAVDWWALGVMLFEFCNGYPPFDGETVEDVFAEILSGNIKWPAAEYDEMSQNCKLLITKLLDNDPEKRLHPAYKVKAHPFFSDVDWMALPSEMPPYIPERSSEEDTSAFEERDVYFPMEADLAIDQEDDASSSSSDEEDSDTTSSSSSLSSSQEDINNKKKSSLTNFWHVNVQNLAKKR